jgi:hypothetical protein
MYVLEPGESLQVDSGTADPIGLKVGVVFDTDVEVCRLFCKNKIPKIIGI